MSSDSFDLKFDLLKKDKAGSIWTIGFGSKSFIIAATRKGAPRAGHYHKSDQIYYILAGSFDYEEMIPGDPSSKRNLVLNEGEVYRIRPGYAHLLRARNDSFHAEYLVGKYESTPFEPYQKIVSDYYSA